MFDLGIMMWRSKEENTNHNSRSPMHCDVANLKKKLFSNHLLTLLCSVPLNNSGSSFDQRKIAKDLGEVQVT